MAEGTEIRCGSQSTVLFSFLRLTPAGVCVCGVLLGELNSFAYKVQGDTGAAMINLSQILSLGVLIGISGVGIRDT